ncbi:unnamed protein product [Penicillium olsonii]|nr:unnamed protein product [Penicillium olsonii]
MSNPNEYTVGWICALATEYVAAQVCLDEIHDRSAYLPSHRKNDFTLGRIGKHNVVISVLPESEYGTSSAAMVAEDLIHDFPNIRLGLMVGIGGGVPSQKHDIRLGDIVIGIPRGDHGGVLQYDYGRMIQGQAFQPTGFSDQPPLVLRAAVNGLKAQYESEGSELDDRVHEILEKAPRLRSNYQRPDPASDRLYRSQFVHPSGDESTCALSCGDDPSNLVLRSPRTEDNDASAIHYGLIASGNQVIKSALIRDKLAAQHDILCFEMEAAGLMNKFPCLVIRGICDYADSHRNMAWRGYAAMIAAAYAKDLLYQIGHQQVTQEARAANVPEEVVDYGNIPLSSHNSGPRIDVNHGEWGPTIQQEFESETEDDSKSTMSYQTDVESILSVGSQVSSQSSQGGLGPMLIPEFAHLLLKDNGLKLLYPTAISNLGVGKFQRNFTRFLKRYGKGLQSEASNERQRQAGQFVCLFARRTTARMSEWLRQDKGEGSLGQMPRSSLSNLAKVDDWLNLLDEHDSDLRLHSIPHDSESSESEDEKQISLETLEEVKGFMVSTRAFSTLRQEFQDWLETSKRHGDKDMTKSKEPALEAQEESRILDPTFVQGLLYPGNGAESLSETAYRFSRQSGYQIATVEYKWRRFSQRTRCPSSPCRN